MERLLSVISPNPPLVRFSRMFFHATGVCGPRYAGSSSMLTSHMQLCTTISAPGSYLNAYPISYEEMPVLDWACTFLSKFSSRRQRYQPHDLERLSPEDLKLLKNYLRGVRVTVSVPAGGRRPARPIKDLHADAGNYAFMKGDEETTIKVCSVIRLKKLLYDTLPGLLQREIRLQTSVPKTVWHRRQRPTENDCPRGDLHDRWRADVQESALAGANVGGLATCCQKSA